MHLTKLLTAVIAAALVSLARADAGRTTLSLDGQWQIADGKSATDLPTEFAHTVPVPGLANLATPGFKDVDQFISRENLANRVRSEQLPRDWLTNYWNGKVNQDRDYFWYRKTFRAPAKREVALLKINKAQFGTAVWLNGKKLGEYAGCFSASYFHLEDTIRWNAENTLVVRIGAHPAVLPEDYPTGSDFEKIKWTPGIYDSVSLIFCDNPLIETIQVAPRIASNEIVVQTKVKNCGAAATTASLVYAVKTWKGGKRVAQSTPETLTLQAGEEKVVTQTIKIPDAHLWSPEDPFLYVVESSTGADSVKTRFGMREFRFDAASNRAYLNGKVYYLRGSNIALHRFLEDPLCGDLPWQEAWVRKLLGDIPKKMHWNYFRFSIGPVPDRWLEICDETGLLVQNEFFVWTGWRTPKPSFPGYVREYDPGEMIRQYSDWMRDNWNHPSVVVWDANNETQNESFGEKIIPAVRPLDLSDRPWENSYNQPVSPNDPVEDHPYMMGSGRSGKLLFNMTHLEKREGKPSQGSRLPSYTNPLLVNEYGWLWVNRDGTPTVLTENVFAQLMGTNVTGRERLDMYAYVLAGKTEYWRAHRHYAGILHFVYLTCSYPGVYTSDSFNDVTKPTLDPAFADYVSEAFKPLGVYLNFFQPTLKAGDSREFLVKLVNDYGEPVSGLLTLTLETKKGRVLAKSEQPFSMKELGATDCRLTLKILVQPAEGLILKATAAPKGKERTVSRRWVDVR